MTDERPHPPCEPFGNMRFSVEIVATAATGALEVVFPEARLVGASRKAGSATYGPLILRRALTASREWYHWWDGARRTRRAPMREVRVHLLDRAGAACVGWRFEGATPVAYHLSPLHALGNEVVVETLELKVRHFETITAPAPDLRS